LEDIIKKLYENIQKLIGFHRQLLDCVRSEKETLVASELKAIQEITYAKEVLINSIKSTEKERIQLVAELAFFLKKPIAELTLPNIAIAIQGEDLKQADLFRSAQNTLVLLIKRITEQNQENLRLVEGSLEHIHKMKENVLKECEPLANTYSHQGQTVSSQNGSRLLNKEA
jgi:flagellar biosynthesis/type III secretory pathway chaperone